MQTDIERAIRDEAKRLDELYYQLPDVLDVKASIILVVDTFLGTLSGQVLALKDLPLAIKLVQLLAVAILCVVIIITIRGIWPDEFEAPPKPEEWADYVTKLDSHYAGRENSSALVLQQLEQAMKNRTLERIAVNRKAAETKAKANGRAFVGTAAIIVLQLVTLVWLAFWHL